MSEQSQIPLICPNGHGGPPVGSGVFCTICGIRLIPASQIPPHNAQAIPQAIQQQVMTGQPQPAPPGQPGYQPMPGYGQPQGQFYGPAPVMPQRPATFCSTCGGDGSRLTSGKIICTECNWLRPLAPGYRLECSAFQWGQDGSAMARLRNIGPLNAAARAISDKVGRRWIEAAFNAVLLSEKQLPAMHSQSVLAARILGMQYMPDVYISGDKMWDAATYGSDTNSFIILGTALVTNFQGMDLLFLLAREMGHCRAGHALWKTVIRFLAGEQGPRRGILGGGILKALNPANLVEGAIELPLLAWARQAEITADRAGLLAVGEESIARKVLLSWCLKSSVLFKQINIEAWLEQQEDSEDQFTRLSEAGTSSTPYITRRLKLMKQFARSPEMDYWRSALSKLRRPQQSLQPAGPQVTPPPGASPEPLQAAQAQAPPENKDDDFRMKCTFCGASMRVPRSVMAGREILKVKCPSDKCGKIVTLKKKPSQPQESKISEGMAKQISIEGNADSE